MRQRDVVVGALGALIAQAAVGGAQTVRDVPLTIARHPSAFALDERTADAILEGISRELQRPSEPGHQSCPIRLTRSGPVATTAAMPDTMDGPQDMDELRRVGRDVVVLAAINWCGTSGFAQGCTFQPGRPGFAVVRWVEVPALEGKLWGHEYGHTAGLPDVLDDDARLMARALSERARNLTRSECDAMLRVRTASAQPASPAAASPGPLGDIGAFVGQFWPHGIPFEAALRFTPEQVRSVLPLLREWERRATWVNVVLTAGAAGGGDATEALWGFLQQREANPGDAAVFAAKLAVPTALGFLANRLGDKRATSLLISASSPRFWREVGGVAALAARSDAEASSTIPGLFARQSILGLALSNQPEAREHLSRLAEQASVGRLDIGQPAQRQARLIQTAIELSEDVASRGLEAAQTKPRPRG